MNPNTMFALPKTGNGNMRTGYERYTYIWIEGYEQLRDFCLQRFKMAPHLCEHSGTCGPAHIKLHYKEDKDGIFHPMYFLYMESAKGEYYSWRELHKNIEMKCDYEQIKADRRSILIR